jgi:TonB family protein
MRQHISKNFNYPVDAQELGLQGRVNLMFTIDVNGNVGDIKKRGPHYLLENEAVRIIKKLPKMQPGLKNGNLVNMAYSIPISFRLSGGKASEVMKEGYWKGKAKVPFSYVDNVPIFPGCEDNINAKACFNKMMQSHISKNFNYPKEAIEKGIEGQVNVMFTISEEGSIIDIRKKGPNELLENEVERIIKKLPKMTPGNYDGKNVNVPYSIPITFKLK